MGESVVVARYGSELIVCVGSVGEDGEVHEIDGEGRRDESGGWSQGGYWKWKEVELGRTQA